MALWEVNRELVYADGALSIPNPSSGTFVKRFSYTVPYSNVGKGGIISINGKTYHVPSWTEVHPQTTLDDIVVEKKPFEELFVEEKKWTFKSSSSDKEYTVRHNAKGNLSCNCMGYIGHKKCKHIREVSSEIVA